MFRWKQPADDSTFLLYMVGLYGVLGLAGRKSAFQQAEAGVLL